MIQTLKVIFISTSVLSAAVALKLSAPAIAEFAVTEVPSIYNAVVSWLRPPYLYLLVNCIIITILASSKLHSNSHNHLDPLQPSPPPPVSAAVLPPPHLEPLKPHDLDLVSRNEVVAEVAVEYDNGNDFADLNQFEEKSLVEIGKEVIGVNIGDAAVADDASKPEVEISGYKDEFAISKSSSAPTTTTSISLGDSLEFPVFNEKPPVSSRFGHRRSVKASPEGGKAALGVSKPKRQDTLESTWRTITEGRAMPLTRHFRKSDTWDTHGGRQPQHQPHHLLLASPNPKMLKSETFSEGGNNNNSSRLSRSPSGSGGKLRREASPGQDELNRRVEAFIKKFNEEMRLQRQESLNQYLEMIHRGAN